MVKPKIQSPLGASNPKSIEADGDSSHHEEHAPQGPYDNSRVPKWSWHAVIMGVFVSMGGLIFGYDTGQISGFLAMPDFQRQFGQMKADGSYEFSDVRAGLIVSLLSIGNLMGALTAGRIADKIGRKRSVFCWCIMLSVGLVIQITSNYPKWYQVVVGRWVTGLGVGSLSLLVPMYQSESAPRQIRGALIGTYQLFITGGMFLANLINFGTSERTDTGSWRIPLGITFLWGIILGLGILIFPETPRHAYRMGRAEEAKRTMARFYGVPQNHRIVAEELAEMKAKRDEDQRAGTTSYFATFTAPRMGFRVALGVALQTFQQLTGANYFFYYGTMIFKTTGVHNPFVTQIILGGMNFGATILGLYIVEHFSRRKTLLFGSAWMVVSMMVFASVGHFALDRVNPNNTPHANIALVVFACIFILGYAATWGPLAWVIVAEMYPSKYRSNAMALATASNWFWNFLLSFFTPFIVNAIDFRYGYVFAGCQLVAAVTVYFSVVEGRGRTLEEIDTMYITHVAPWKSSKWEAPPPDQLVAHERAARGEVAGTGPDAEEGDASREKETTPVSTTVQEEST